MSVDQTTSSGLTARRKERVRQQLAEAAVDLFCERGYDRTTVDDVAAAVEVSPRTVYRYFATKEDLVVSHGQANFAEFVEALHDRPLGESLARAVQAAAELALAPKWQDPVRLRAFMALMRDTPVLRARWVEQAYDSQRHLGAVIAARTGADPAGIGPLVAAGAIAMVINTALSRWADGDSDATPDGAVSEALALLEAPLLSPITASELVS
jgi:AcrR family transcriptional regulator